MKIAQNGSKRCEFCHAWFTPDPRTAKFQRSCSKPDCRKQRSATAVRNWWLRNPNYHKSRGPKIKAWAKAYPGYWRKYRKEHPDYAKKERHRMRSARRLAKNVAKQNAIAQISLEKLESIQDLGLISVAKQNAIQAQVTGILEFLCWKEKQGCAAKQDKIAFTPAIKREYEYAGGNLG